MQFKKLLFMLLICTLFTRTGLAQQKKVVYGDNPAAGKYYNVNGIKLYTETYGTGKPLLLIHGNGDKMSAFKFNIAYFAKKYKVIAVDSRAHGKSTDPSDSLTFEQMADDFATLLDVMHIKAAYIIGWSDGGINALEMAMRHPDKVIKLASTGANLWPDATGLLPSAWKEMQKYYQEHKNTVWKTAKEKNDWKIFMLDYEQPHIKLSQLQKIKCPSLIIGGDHDVIPTEHTVLISQNIPQSYLWIVPNSGHPTLQEHADDFNKLVDEFFEKPYKKR
jgi:pimeloyl-ACP methyl ester carboxylesterase